MDNNGSQINLAEIMAGNEEMISRHYRACAEQFPENRDFWDTLAGEELDHARWIRELYARSGKGALAFNEKRFNKESLREFGRHLDSMLSGFRAQSGSMRQALQVALNIEGMLLESSVFEVFTADSPELKMILERLASATKEHSARIKEAMEAV